MIYPKTAKIIFLLFFVISAASMAVAEDRDIGLRVRTGGADVPLAACSNECPGSELNVYKNGRVNGIKLVAESDPARSNVRVKTTTGVRAVKRYTPLTGNFNQIHGPDKYSVTFVSSITCRCTNGTQVTIGPTGGGINSPFVVYNAVVNAISSKGLSITPPGTWPNPSEVCLFQRTTGGSGGGNTWNDGAQDLVTLNAICQILGYDSYVSSTCRDQERSGLYPSGKCNWHSTGDNCIAYFTP